MRVGLGADEDILARVGALQTVTWKILPEEEFWEVEDVDLDTTIVGDERRGRGVLVEVVYERSRYTAVLMREEKDKSEGDTGHGDGEKGGFQRFPLLLTRMPGSLRETFLQFLERNFDARISSLCLGKEHMIGALESYIIDCGRDEDGELQLSNMGQVSKSVLRDVQVVIGFEAGVSLKTIEVLIMTEDVTKMVMSGRRLERKDGTSMYLDVSWGLSHWFRHDMLIMDICRTRISVYGSNGELYRRPSSTEYQARPSKNRQDSLRCICHWCRWKSKADRTDFSGWR